MSLRIALIAVISAVLVLTVQCAFAQPSQPVLGFADLHTHPASHLAFGADANGNNGFFWGKPGMAVESSDPDLDMPPCVREVPIQWNAAAVATIVLLASQDSPPAPLTCAAIGAGVPTLLLGPEAWLPLPPIPVAAAHGAPSDYVQALEQRQILQGADNTEATITAKHGTNGSPSFTDWPSPVLVEHQQMHITAIKRAFDAGLRLLFASATDNQLLSNLWHVGFNLFPQVPAVDPEFDLKSAERQIDFIQSLADANSSWMQIVRTPAEARQAINANKLAVVLSVEMDALSMDDITELVSRGVRHVIPIHLADSLFGGSAVYNDLWNANTYYLNHSFFQVDFDTGVSFQLGVPKRNSPLKATPDDSRS